METDLPLKTTFQKNVYQKCMLNSFFQLSTIIEERKQKYSSLWGRCNLKYETVQHSSTLDIQPLANPSGSFMFKSQVRTFLETPRQQSSMKPGAAYLAHHLLKNTDFLHNKMYPHHLVGSVPLSQEYWHEKKV